MKKLFSIILFVTIIFVFSACRGSDDIPSPTTTEPTTEKNYYIDGNGWAVPIYESVEQAEFDPRNFSLDENGRISYNDKTISTATGVDLSAFQGYIDWEKVACDGIDFVILRAGCRGWGPSGLIYEDDMFNSYYENARAVGLDVGVYFYSQAVTNEEAKNEAEFVLSLIYDKEITYPIAFDWERPDDSESETKARTANINSDQVSEFASVFCKTIKAAGYEPVIYFSCADGYSLFNLEKISDYEFWIAEYDDAPKFYYNYKIWQYSCEGSVDGISQKVDLNICMNPSK